MHYRELGRTGFKVSAIGFGAWAIGGSWGRPDEDQSKAALEQAVEAGVNFFDTADVYGMGRSERLIGQLKKARPESLVVATKAGRRADPHDADSYNYENLKRWAGESLNNLGGEALDLLQLHCPPTEVYYRPEVFAALDKLAAEGLIRHYGVSVEKVEEGLKAIEYPGVKTVQIIFNPLRQRPKELFFQECARRNVGIIVRVPLASGLLTGKMTKDTQFAAEDHRRFNREGQHFDRGETFAGIPFAKGLEAAEAFKALAPAGWTPGQLALAWILSHDEVSTVIPGARNAGQVSENVRAAEMPPLSADVMKAVADIYQRWAFDEVHQRW